MSDDKKYNVFSVNQMGGITAGQVNIGPQARQMDDANGQQIKQHIPTSAKVKVTSVMGDGEAFNFATQIKQWLESNGYSNVDGVNQAIYSQPVMGQGIERKSESEFEIIIGTRQ